MAEENKEQQTQQTEPKENKEVTQQEKTEPKVDVEKVKNDAISELLKTLGVDDKEKLQGIVTKAKEDEEANKTDLQKKDDTITTTTKELAAEREARIIAEAKLSAIMLGAKAELVDHLVVVAKSKVTKGKDINAVITEIKDSEAGKVYFESKDEEEEEKSNKATVTRARVTKPTEKTKEKKKDDKDDTGENAKEKHAGSMAERLLAGRKTKQNHYFK